MSLIAGLSVVNDMCFYCTLLAMAHLLNDAGGRFLLMPLVMGLCAGIGHALGDRGKKRYLSLLVLPAALSVCTTGVTYVALIPACVYTFLIVQGNRRVIDYYYAFTRFRSCFLLLSLVTLFVIFINKEAVWLVTLPYLFLFLVLSINLLRMLRHDEKTMRQWRFRLSNLSGTAGVCAAGLVFSTGLAQRFFRWLVAACWDSVLHPVVNWCLDLVTGIVKLVYDLLTLLPLDPSFDLSSVMDNPALIKFNEVEGEAIAEDMGQYPFVKYVLAVLGIAIGGVIFIAVMKFLSRGRDRARDNDLTDVRERLDPEPAAREREPGFFARRREPVLAVRYWYRRFLELCEANHIALKPSSTSLDARDAASARFGDAEALDGLREVYLPARYSPAPAGKDDAERAKALYERVRRAKK